MRNKTTIQRSEKNPRKVKGFIFILLAALLAAIVFGIVSVYLKTIQSQVGNFVYVYQAKDEIPAYTELEESLLVEARIPERWVSESARVSLNSLEGRRIPFTLEPGTTITRDMLIPTSDIDPNEREIAINVDAVTGIAGRVQTGDFVDVYAVFGDVPGLTKQVQIIAQNVRIVSVQGQKTMQEEESGSISEQSVIPVTLAVPTNTALAITYAANFAEEVRLVGLPNDGIVNREGDKNLFDAQDLGGSKIEEQR